METYRLETADRDEFKQAIVEAQAAGDVEVTVVTGTEGKRTEDGFTQVAYFVYEDDDDETVAEDPGAEIEAAPVEEPPADPVEEPPADPVEEPPADLVEEPKSAKPTKGKT